MKYDVFISFKRGALDGNGLTRDYELASDLHRTLIANGVNAFFSEKDLSSSAFVRDIYRALDEAKILIVVGTKPEHVESEWVHSEWEIFLTAMLGGRKPDSEIYTYLEGMTNNALPLELYGRQSFQSNQKEELVRWVKRNLGIVQPVPPAPKPVPVSVPQPEPKLDVRVGDIVKFGQYPQGANGEVAPIEWRVLDVKDGKALLLSDKLLDYVQYNEKDIKVTWETCTLRKWMNEDFIRKAFSSGEQSRIATVTNANPNNPKHRTKGGNATQDKVFALSIDEVRKYFSSDDAMKAYATEYAYKNSSDWIKKIYSSKDALWWWLRSPGYASDFAAGVLFDGGVTPIGGIVSDDRHVAVRLAFWLNL